MCLRSSASGSCWRTLQHRADSTSARPPDEAYDFRLYEPHSDSGNFRGCAPWRGSPHSSSSRCSAHPRRRSHRPSTTATSPSTPASRTAPTITVRDPSCRQARSSSPPASSRSRSRSASRRPTVFASNGDPRRAGTGGCHFRSSVTTDGCRSKARCCR